MLFLGGVSSILSHLLSRVKVFSQDRACMLPSRKNDSIDPGVLLNLQGLMDLITGLHLEEISAKIVSDRRGITSSGNVLR